MNGFIEQLRDGLKHCGVGHERLLVGVSGGADSVALLRGLVEVATEFSLELCVAHLNHRLRGTDSDIDAEFVRELSASLNLPCEVGLVLKDELSASSSALEENARRLRHRFLDEAASKLNCATIAVAHTADDQTETVLHHLFRGTGMSGLRGIPEVRKTAAGLRLVRPILAIKRTEIEEYLLEYGQSFRTDASNADTSMTRNRLRHVVLPMLREQINPQVDAAIARLAEQAADIEQYLKFAAGQLLQKSLKDQQPDACRLDVGSLSGQPRHIVREMFRELWNHQKWPVQAMGFEQWNRLLEILTTRETITLPNRIEARFHAENLLVLRRIAS